jgi:antigen flippase
MSAPSTNNPTTAATADAPAMPPPGRSSSYAQILRSSALIGGASVLNIGISVIRTKVMAILLGPAGFGVTGLYISILDLAKTFAAMGISTSGVRQIAVAVGTGDELQIARTAQVLRRTALVLGVVGALMLAALSWPVAHLTFGKQGADYVGGVALLSLGVLFYTVSGGLDAWLQGMRRIGDLARIAVIGTVAGVIVTIVIIYFLRERGIPLALVSVAAASMMISYWFSRRIPVAPVKMSTFEVCREARDLLKLGAAFLASGLLTMGAAYAIRVIILRHFGNEAAELGKAAAGYYQSAWMLGGMYVGIILQAMGADFYPRLTAAADNNEECNRLVNEQSQVSLLLAGPGVLATLTFAPLVIATFYTSQFTVAVEPLRWICLGMALRVAVWPLGFIVVAKGRQGVFLWTEVLATAVHVGLAYVGCKFFGVTGACMGFVGLYVVHGIVISLIVRQMSGFRWARENVQIGLVMMGLMSVAFAGFMLLPFWPSAIVGGITLTLSIVYSLRSLLKLVAVAQIPRPVRRLLVMLRLAPSEIH